MAERKRKNFLLRTTAALLLLFVLYVASFGPMIWLVAGAGGIPMQIFLLKLYAPIHWLIENGPEPIANALEWYAKLF